MCQLCFVLGIHVFLWRLIIVGSRNIAPQSCISSVISFDTKTSTRKQSSQERSTTPANLVHFNEYTRTENPCLTFEALMTIFLADPCSSPEKAGWLLKPCFTFTAVSSSCKECFKGKKMQLQFKNSHHSEKHVFIKKIYVFASTPGSAFTWTLQGLCTFTGFQRRGTRCHPYAPVPIKCLPYYRLQGRNAIRMPLVLLKEECCPWEGARETRPQQPS